MGEEKTVLEHIPSQPDNKFGAFQRHRDVFSKQRWPVAKEMNTLHGLVTSGVDMPELGKVAAQEQAGALLMFGVGEDVNWTRNYIQSIINGNSGQRLLEALNGSEIDGAKVRVNTRKRGVVRNAGTVQTPDSKPKEIAPIIFTTVSEDGMDSYYPAPFGTNMSRLWGKLCDHFDKSINEVPNGDLQAHLMEVAFFNLVGICLIHPYSDANGRTFSAQILVELERLGFKVDNVPSFPEIAPAWSESIFTTSSQFVSKFNHHFSFDLISFEEYRCLLADKAALERWSRRQMASIKRVIEFGTDPNGPFFAFYDNVAELIMMWLSREGKLSDNGAYYNEHLPRWKEAWSNVE